MWLGSRIAIIASTATTTATMAITFEFMCRFLSSAPVPGVSRNSGKIVDVDIVCYSMAHGEQRFYESLTNPVSTALC